MPKISIITPVFNGAEYLDIAINSALAQTISDWELIVVDDGSTDNTPKILNQYQDKRIIRLHQENQGEACARNTGLNIARGQYISFLDADDILLPNSLANLSKFLDEHQDYDVVFSDGYICNEHASKLMRLTEIRSGVHTGNILEPLVLSSTVITVPICTMTRRSAIQDNDIQFDQNLVIGTDWDFWIQLARFVRFGYLDQPTCMYRIHQSNITRTTGLQRRKLNLTLGRLKVMKTGWFSGLSITTRKAFFYQLLIEILDTEPQLQQDILRSNQFKNLPLPDQAHLWRQVGISKIKVNTKTTEAEYYIKQASVLSPKNLKTQILLRTLKFNPLLVFWLIKIWQYFHQIKSNIGGWRNKKPKPVPLEIGPVKN